MRPFKTQHKVYNDDPNDVYVYMGMCYYVYVLETCTGRPGPKKPGPVHGPGRAYQFQRYCRAGPEGLSLDRTGFCLLETTLNFNYKTYPVTRTHSYQDTFTPTYIF